ncbi:conserved hypothetical protein [Cupriavidus necator]|uniref:DUF4224 domain-containing protein n=1 Tax=Cupriavidus necator TaxID=106590 RepID=A0A1K0I9G7_CUPNE|nr:conserved hypothetical protein [Cupriavidus necator]
MSTLTLSEDEIRDLTKRKQRKVQAAMLRAIGIEPKARPDGTLVVFRAQIERLLGDKGGAGGKRQDEPEPDWSAV